ncbi:phospholipase A2 AP-PLA2-I-like isoform X2 [Patiria miniata]|nr:phospholipase A2 AP-PLA2-I-like isoform X2 [Patiria miniata]
MTSMVMCIANLNTWEVMSYTNYGCFCGKGGIGNTPVDETDRCCQVHDICFDDAMLPDVGCSANDIYWANYLYGKRDNPDGKCSVQCVPEADYPASNQNAKCKAFLCECDRVVAECVARHRSSFSAGYVFHSWKWGSCSN